MAETEEKPKRPPRKRKPHAENPGAKKKGNADQARDEPRRLKQQTIPDPNKVSLPDLDEAAEEYVSLRDKRMRTGEQETEAGAKLLNLMHAHKIKSYVYDGKEVKIEDVEKVKVKKLKGEED